MLLMSLRRRQKMETTTINFNEQLAEKYLIERKLLLLAMSNNKATIEQQLFAKMIIDATEEIYNEKVKQK